MLVQTTTINQNSKYRACLPANECAVCGSKAIGINFAVPTCAPCKAFFRRNARRKHVLELPCQFRELDVLSKENNEQDKSVDYCSQLRHCGSCRLHRCFDVGMREELVRTDEEKQRYKQLIEINRQRRRDTSKSHGQQKTLSIIPRRIVRAAELLNETDWTLLSNIVNAYDNYCLKFYIQNEKMIFHDEAKFSKDTCSKVNHHIEMRVNNVGSILSFLLSMPIIQLLSKDNLFYLCKHNIRSLIFPNIHEIEQSCFIEPWQRNANDRSAEYVFGKELFLDYLHTKSQAARILITDPVVTRLWLVVLFFSAPLQCYYDRSLPEASHESRLVMNNIQNSYIILLWNYLLHRHEYLGAVRIFSTLIRVYLQMQRINVAISIKVRTRNDLVKLNQALDHAAMGKTGIQ